jgi:ABC-type Fe3+-citrate transport system substrate-binding protein
MQLAISDNEIAEGIYKQNNDDVPTVMLDSEKTQYNNNWRNYQERNELLTKHRGQAFSLILGQCTQLLQDRMKQDTDWNMASMSYVLERRCQSLG